MKHDAMKSITRQHYRSGKKRIVFLTQCVALILSLLSLSTCGDGDPDDRTSHPMSSQCHWITSSTTVLSSNGLHHWKGLTLSKCQMICSRYSGSCASVSWGSDEVCRLLTIEQTRKIKAVSTEGEGGMLLTLDSPPRAVFGPNTYLGFGSEEARRSVVTNLGLSKRYVSLVTPSCMCNGAEDDRDGDGVMDCVDICPGEVDPSEDLNGDSIVDVKDCGCIDPVTAVNTCKVESPVQLLPNKLAGDKVSTLGIDGATITSGDVSLYLGVVDSANPILHDAFCFNKGQNYLGTEGLLKDIDWEWAMRGVGSPRDCQRKCWAWPECNFFAFSYGEGCRLLTWLDDSLEGGVKDDHHAFSGPKFCENEEDADAVFTAGGCLDRGCRYDANPLGNGNGDKEKITTPFRCQAQCQLVDTCVGFSYNYATAICRLHDWIGERVTTNGRTTTSAMKQGLSTSEWCGPRSCALWPPLFTTPSLSYVSSLINPPLSSPMEDYIYALVSRMPLSEKVSQMVLTNDVFVSPETLSEFNVNVLWPPSAQDMFWMLGVRESSYEHSTNTNGGTRLGIPSITAVDAVHGFPFVSSATMFPHNVGLGCANDEDLMKRIGNVIGTEMGVLGVEWALAPMVAVPTDYRFGRTYEGFSEDGKRTSRLAENLVIGMQEGSGSGQGVAAMCKHFLADGATQGGMTDGDAELGEDELAGDHVAPFLGCFRAGVMSTMPSFNDVNGIELHQHKHYITDILKGTYGFDGVVTGDHNAHSHIPSCPVSAVDCPEAIIAGVDMLLISTTGGGHFSEFIINTMRQTNEGIIPLSRINDATTRILRMKAKLGLLSPATWTPPALKSLTEEEQIEIEKNKPLPLILKPPTPIDDTTETTLDKADGDATLAAETRIEDGRIAMENKDSLPVVPAIGKITDEKENSVVTPIEKNTDDTTRLRSLTRQLQDDDTKGEKKRAETAPDGIETLTPPLPTLSTEQQVKSPKSRMYAGKWDLLGSPGHTAIAREAVTKSAVLLKNARKALPLSPDSNILVTGKADSVSLSCGAWTLGWQGVPDDTKFGDDAVHLFEGIKRRVTKGGGKVVFDKEGESLARTKNLYDAIVHVMAEDPYAEALGDLDDGESLMHHREKTRFGPNAYPEDLDRLLLVRHYAPQTPIIVILYSGRPLYINAEMNLSDAFIAAWLPCKQAGEGLGDLLFGTSDFTGRLSMAWPNHPCQFKVRTGDGQTPLFSLGYGLSLEEEEDTKDPSSRLVGLEEIEQSVCAHACKEPHGLQHTYGFPGCNLGQPLIGWED